MGILGRLLRRLRYLLGAGALDARMDEEMRFHIEMETEKNVRAGMAPAEARREAMRAFGGVERHREATREARGTLTVESVLRDAGLAFRELGRSPVFAVTTVVSLALGMAATTLVMSTGHTVLLRPVAAPEPERLVAVNEDRRGPNTNIQNGHVAIDHRRIAAMNRAAEGAVELAGYTLDDYAIAWPDRSEGVLGARVTRNYFDVLGLVPARGRFFDPRESGPGGPAEVVVSHHYWTEAMGADPAAVGRTVRVDGRPHVVVGIAPEGFYGVFLAIAAEIWVPADLEVWSPAGERRVFLATFGRVAEGVPVADAERVVDAAARSVPPETEGVEIRGARLGPLTPLPAAFRGAATGFLSILLAMGGLVLLVAATNVAGMLLARAAARGRELAVRVALGATRVRLVRQRVTETTVLFAAGGALGLVTSIWLVGVVNALRLPLPVRLELGVELTPAIALLAWSGTVVLGVVFGTLVGLATTSRRLWAAGGTFLRSRDERSPLRKGFVVAQLAVTVVLLFTAALFTRAVHRTLGADPGIDPEGLVTAGVDPVPAGYAAPEAEQFLVELMERLRARPGVVASASRTAPLSGGVNSETARLPDGTEEPVYFGWVEGAWFETAGTPIVAGRTFTPVGQAGPEQREVIVNETLARRLWGDASPLGRTFRMLGDEHTVVGVARDGRYAGAADRGSAYVFVGFGTSVGTSTRVWIRAPDRTVASGVRILREEVAAMDPDLAPQLPNPVEDLLAFDVAPQRWAAGLITTFGALGLLLAAVGVYGTTAHRVARRAREIGIRLALGAPARSVGTEVMAGGLRLAAVGLGLGLLGALAVSRLIEGLIFGVGLDDPWILVSVPAILGLVTAAAVAVPARRATRVDPVRLLRVD